MKVITLNNKAFQNSCNILFSKLQQDFDMVLGIQRGGQYVLDAFLERHSDIKASIRSVTIQKERDFQLKKNRYIRFILRYLPYGVLNTLRIVESKLLFRKSKRTDIKGTVHIDFEDINTSVKSVLILDDAVDTGKTISSVVTTLRKTMPDIDIHVGVLSWTNSKSLVTPHYYVYKDVLVRFPWSIDYKTRSDA